MNTKSISYLAVVLLGLSFIHGTGALAGGESSTSGRAAESGKGAPASGEGSSSRSGKDGSRIVVLDQGKDNSGEEAQTRKSGRSKERSSSLHSPRKQDEVSLSTRREELIVSIALRRGIGQAKIRLQAKSWPEVVQLRFKKFAGLEGLTATNGERMIALHARHNEPNQPNEPDEPGAKQLAVVRKSDGFEVVLPRGFLRDDDRVLSLQWVDFYR